MNFDVTGAAVYFTIPTGIPILGDIQITETRSQLDCDGADYGTVYLADP